MDSIIDTLDDDVPTSTTWAAHIRRLNDTTISASIITDATGDMVANAKITDNRKAPFDWLLYELWSDYGPTEAVTLALWQTIVRAAGANGVRWISAEYAAAEKLNRAALGPFVNQVCDLDAYRVRLEHGHEHAAELFFDGVGLESVVALPKSLTLPRPTKENR